MRLSFWLLDGATGLYERARSGRSSSRKVLAPFHRRDFWQGEYRRGEYMEGEDRTFEWYADYDELRPTIARLLDNDAGLERALHVGCGTSTLGVQLFDEGLASVRRSCRPCRRPPRSPVPAHAPPRALAR